ncbi:hypothetical protein FS842_002257 [Serendipita sp. 407]|nr:hypothetical protein FS842_002257 [Serendipita sp. 407]
MPLADDPRATAPSPSPAPSSNHRIPLSSSTSTGSQLHQHASHLNGSPSSSAPLHSSGTLTLESVLQTYGKDPLVALEAMIQERNALTLQNEQLWKLIEKQRSAFHAQGRELERLKASVNATSSGSANTPTKEKDLSGNPDKALDTSSPARRERPPRDRPTRTDSEDQHSQKHPTVTSRGPVPAQSQEPQNSSTTPSPFNSNPRLNGAPSSLGTSAAPAVGSAEVLAVQHPQRPVRGESLPNPAPVPIISSPGTAGPTGPLNVQKKGSLPASSTTSQSIPPPVLPVPAVVPVPDTTSMSRPSPQLPASSLATQSSNTGGLGSLLAPQPRDRRIARESRITLPDEAARYIAMNLGLGESPSASPKSKPTEFGNSQNTGAGDIDATVKSKGAAGPGDDPYSVEPSPIEVEVAYPSVTADSGASGGKEKRYPPAPIHPPPPVPMTGSGSATRENVNAGKKGDSVDYTDMSTPVPSQPTPASPQSQSRSSPQLSPGDLTSTRVTIVHSNIRTNERGKEVLSFVIIVQPPRGDDWRVEKLYSDVVALDVKVRGALGRSQAKRLPQLPDSKLFKDNAPAKVDQRRVILEQYLQTLLTVPLKDPSDICIFFSSDVSRGDRAPMGGQGYKEGYLTKRGKNFGGWKTRYFVLQNAVLEYFEGRGGTHLGTINISGAQIGRQQKQASVDDENSYRHAFLIIEQAKKGAVPTRHVLCAASDAERDEWVDVLVRSVAPSYPGSSYREDAYLQSDSTLGGDQSRPSTSSNAPSEWDRGDGKKYQGIDDFSSGNSPIERPSGQHQPQSLAWTDAQLAQRSVHPGHGGTQSADNGVISLSSSVESAGELLYQQARSNSSLGHHGESPKDPRSINSQSVESVPSSAMRNKADKTYSRTSHHPAVSTLKSAHQPTSADRGDDSSAGESTTAGSVLSSTAPKKISGPMNAQPIPANQKFGNKEGFGSTSELSPAGGDRKMKAGSRFWPSFGKSGGNNPSGGPDRAAGIPIPAGIPGRPVFNVPLEQALMVAQIANLPAIVFRCVEYLEAKKAAQEEGIYRLNGSSMVIKALKDRFNHEGDVNLLKYDEYWDLNAISGLLKQYLRDLPTSILTRELQQSFLSVVDLMDPKERVNELAHLVSQLPVANYSLLRAMSAHLILIVQNSAINKMTMRNVGIVFSPTLGIPAGILSLMLGEFDRVFNVDGADASSDVASSNEHESYSPSHNERTPQKGGGSAERPVRRLSYQGQEKISKRNSTLYASTAADRMLGLGGRKLDTTEDSSDIEEVSMPGDSDTETDGEEPTSRQTASEHAASGSPPSPAPQISVSYPVTDVDPSAAPTLDNHMHGAKAVAATRGLQIAVTGKKIHRASGLPSSPRPIRYPGSPSQTSNI